MSQTLTALSGPSSPVKVTDSAKLSANLAAIQNLDNREVIALSVISRIHTLFIAGGTDYRTNHKQLRIDAASFMGGFSFPGDEASVFDRMNSVMDWNQGHVNDASLSTDVYTLVSEMAGLRETPEQTLMTFLMFLRLKCSLSGA